MALVGSDGESDVMFVLFTTATCFTDMVRSEGQRGREQRRGWSNVRKNRC